MALNVSWRRAARWAILTGSLLPLVGYVKIRFADNFGTIVPNMAYRSAQMSSASLLEVIRERRIKTVLNLRGPNPDQSWYRDELGATLSQGVTQVDVAMSSCQWMSRAQLRELVLVLDQCEAPLLIHCQHGSERTGLVSALFRLLQPGSTLDLARDEFSISHLFLPIKDGKVMADHLAQYAGWLRANGFLHTPERFRAWIDEGFQPLSPSREQWPYDPYPLVVETCSRDRFFR